MLRNNFLLCLFGISICFVANTVGREAIVGGHIAPEDQFKHQSSVRVDGIDECGGGIIRDEFILTAAHCVTKENGEFDDHVAILSGTKNLHKTERPAVIIAAKKIYIPKEYNHEHRTFGDIAVVKLKHPLGLAHNHHLKALELPKPHDHYYGKTAKISGFGWDHVEIHNHREEGRNTDGKLRYAEADVLHRKDCEKAYDNEIIPENFICARVKKQHDHKAHGVCVNDSGGLLFHGQTVIGVLSHGPTGCDEKRFPGIYMNVAHYLPFIENAIHDRHSPDIRSREYH